MNASSVTARILSLVVLLLSLAPLGSMYVLFFSMGIGTNNNEHIDTTEADTLAAVLKNPNATLEELWTAVFATQNQHIPAVLAALSNNNNNEHLLRPLAANSRHHLRLLLPWIMSLILGVVLPCVLSIATFWQRRRRQQRHRRREWNANREKKVRKRITRQLKRYSMSLTDKDRYSKDCEPVDDRSRNDVITKSNRSLGEDDELSSSWLLPKPGFTIDDMLAAAKNETQTSFVRIVNVTCGVCLESFDVGDCVAWSSNPSCIHSFHEKCIRSWLIRTYRCAALTPRRDGDQVAHEKDSKLHHCPCCRQTFLAIEPKDAES